jgi:hypothetical protein
MKGLKIFLLATSFSLATFFGLAFTTACKDTSDQAVGSGSVQLAEDASSVPPPDDSGTDVASGNTTAIPDDSGTDGVSGNTTQIADAGTDGVSGDITQIADAETDGISGNTTQIDDSGKDSESVKKEHVHAWTNWQVTKEATCKEDGTETRICTADGSTESREIDHNNIAHTASDWIISQAATCQAVGSRYKQCTVCFKQLEREEIPLGDHDYVDAVCSVCGTTDWDNIDLSYLDVYNGTYGYEYLHEMTNGEAMQSLYKMFDKQAKIFHVNMESELPATSVDGFYLLGQFDYGELGLSEEEAVIVWKMYKMDNPLYYWLSNSFETGDDEPYIALWVYEDYAKGEDRAAYNERVYSQIEQYVSLAKSTDSDYQKTLIYHDSIIAAVDYAYNSKGKPETSCWAHNIIGVLDNRGTVCEGYAKTFQILLNYSGVQNILVTSYTHMWNLVQLGDDWYWYDLTWDDEENEYYYSTGERGIYNFFCAIDTQPISSSSTKTFADVHKCNTPEDTYTDFLYELPPRATEAYSDKSQLVLGERFTFESNEYALVGYDAVELEAVGVAGKVTIPETVTYNGNTYTVDSVGCLTDNTENSVSSITLPKTIKYIYFAPFLKFSIEYIYVDEDNPDFRSKDGVLFSKSLTTLIAYPTANKNTEYTLPEETTEFFYAAFTACKNLETVTLSKNIKIISELVFVLCGKLTTVYIPNGVTQIGECAFINCPNLTDIQYDGTKAQWEAIEKNDDWYYGDVEYVVS